MLLKVSAATLRDITIGATVIFQRDSSADDRLVTSFQSRNPEFRFRTKVMIFVDPSTTPTATQVLAVTRTM